MRKDKVNIELVKQLVHEGYNDREIGLRVNRSQWTIRKIRQKKLNLMKDSLFYLNEWRRVTWRPEKRTILGTDAVLLVIPLKLSRMLFPDLFPMCYKLSLQLPNKLLVEFKKEEDIDDKSLIRRRVDKRTRRRIGSSVTV